MKKITFFSGLLMAGLLSLSGCNNGGNKLTKVDRFDLSPAYYNLRVNNGYTSEAHTKFVSEDGEHMRFEVTTVKTLVVPVDFTDYPASSLPKGEQESWNDINKCVFGGENDMKWYSLSRYYATTSYGECKVEGKTLDWFHSGYNSSVLKNEQGESGSTIIAKDIANYVKTNESKLGFKLSDYDSNQDGYIDALIMIYSRPMQPTDDKNLFWAYCWNVAGARGSYPDKVGIYRYFWASYFFFYEDLCNYNYIPNYKGNDSYGFCDDALKDIQDGKAYPDAHTLIHEFGHVLSAPDYYVTDYNSSDYSALGGVDMMDHNVGDHNAYTKASCYGWMTPYVIEKPASLTLKSTTDTGDFAIIPVGEWKHTLLSQYVMVEFLTPTGVTEYDAKHMGKYLEYYSIAGVRITLVDARLGLFTYNSTKGAWVFSSYTSVTKTSASNASISIAASNTASNSAFKNFKEIEVLPATGKSIKNGGKCNTWLYQQGQTFGVGECWGEFKANGISGVKDVDFPWTINIKSLKFDESNPSASEVQLEFNNK